ncbi:alpha/beta hydrolase [Kitasatospora purpeofusca]|uniref:alpha/beta hydrolase n=1 Tax=Kitasatospora purpeofusca TaxID=67352 RepID=UPI0036D2AF64
MSSFLSSRGLRAWAVVAAAVVALLTPSALPAYADPPVPQGPPSLTDGHGLTQVGSVGTATDFTITVTTTAVAKQHPVRIILPPGYWDDPTRRYPVLYFLHGSPDSPVNQNYPALRGSTSMITVIPDGGPRGWYSNWRDQNTAAGAQKWETFHLGQVIPFIDDNLRTVAAKRGRAVAGISMGGFGAMRYAQRHPELFTEVASLSGGLDLSAASMDLRLAVVASLTNAPGGFCGASSSTGGDCTGSYTPAVSSDALFGSPYPVFDLDRLWNEADPAAHMSRLAGIGISIYTGSGAGNPLALEFWIEGANKHARDSLDALHLPYHYVGYGDGAGWGTHCNGDHNAGCWAQDLVDWIPRLERAFAASLGSA